MADAPEEKHYAKCLKNPKTVDKHMYEIKMITSVVWKLVNENNWYLATKIKLAPGFHDLVLKEKNIDKKENDPEYMYCLVQIRHYKSGYNEITTQNTLLSRNKKETELNLINLFKAYLTIIEYNQKNQGITDKEIKYLIIFSNRSISDEQEKKQFFRQIKETSLDIIGFQDEQYYCINTDSNIIAKFKNLLLKEIKCSEHEEVDKSCKVCCQIEKIQTIVNEDEDKLLNFLKKVVFMVKQPSVTKFDKLITDEMGKKFGEEISPIYYNNLFKKINEWYQFEKNGRAPYLTKQDIIENLQNTHEMLKKAQNMEIISNMEEFLAINSSSTNNSSSKEE